MKKGCKRSLVMCKPRKRHVPNVPFFVKAFSSVKLIILIVGDKNNSHNTIFGSHLI